MNNDDYEFKPLKARAIEAPPKSTAERSQDSIERIQRPSIISAWVSKSTIIAVVSFIAGGSVVAGAVSVANLRIPSNSQGEAAPNTTSSPKNSQLVTPTASPTALPSPTASLKVKRGSYSVVNQQPAKKQSVSTSKKKKKKVSPIPTEVTSVNPAYVRRIIGG